MVRWLCLAIAIVMVIGVLGKTEAATATNVKVKCNRVRVSGVTEHNAPYVRVQVALASDLTQVLATKVVKVNKKGEYRAQVRFPRLEENTSLVIAIGEWDGRNVVAPALMIGDSCTKGTTPVPTPTPLPTQETEWHIEYFYADPSIIPAGGCTTIYYWVVGSQHLTLHGSNWLGEPEVIHDNPNGRMICPSAAGNYVPGEPVTYTLNVTYLDGRTESAQTVVTFSDTAPTPTPLPTQEMEWHIEYFYADPSIIPAGGCTTIYYWVVGSQHLTLHGSNWPGEPEVINDNPNGRMICPSAAGNYVPGEPVTYTLNVTYLDGRTESAQTVVTFSDTAP